MADMSMTHKKAPAEGRKQAKAVREYLTTLAKSSRRGRPITKESLEERISRVEQRLAEEENPLKRLELVQDRLDLQRRLSQVEQAADISHLEAEFKKVVVDYSERKDIEWSAWREMGVPASVLREAGLHQTR